MSFKFEIGQLVWTHRFGNRDTGIVIFREANVTRDNRIVNNGNEYVVRFDGGSIGVLPKKAFSTTRRRQRRLAAISTGRTNWKASDTPWRD